MPPVHGSMATSVALARDASEMGADKRVVNEDWPYTEFAVAEDAA